ncbi:hypothetical protein N7474_009182, partial [Penicillium riverlandense]|uniref:uncharacterized protein n=1 Tax=Penicillium riverlandense TaxID=1903569 RepID=UPI00254735FB
HEDLSVGKTDPLDLLASDFWSEKANYSDPCRLLHHKCKDCSSLQAQDLSYQTWQAMRSSRNAVDVSELVGHVCEGAAGPSFVRPKAEIHAPGFHATKFGCDRHHEVERHRSFPTNAVFSNNEFIVDFVFESGNGDSDSLVESSVAGAVVGNEDQPHPDTSSGHVSNEKSYSTTKLRGLTEDSNVLARKADANGSRQLSSRQMSENRAVRSKERSWPLRDAEEADLLQHFVDKITPFFDCTDYQRHFALHIPYRARHCETLFNAILAMSARHLSRTASFDPFVSDHYFQLCLEKLIPALNDHEVTMDDDLLAATVILRLLEEYDAPLAGSDLRGHSFGTKAFIQGPPTTATTTPRLRQAVYWSGLRQEIYNSLSLQQAPDVNIGSLHSQFSWLGQDVDDCTWANQAIAHCTDVLMFSFGEGPRSTAVHAELLAKSQEWLDTRPDSFDPFFIDRDEVEIGATFPDIRFHSAWHAIGNQYNHLARILLHVHDPNLPTIGPLRRRFIQKTDDLIRKGVWTVCGIGLSNASVPPAMVVGCMAIHICGDRFTDRQQQELLVQVLVQTDAVHGWPTHALQRQLRDTWGVP